MCLVVFSYRIEAHVKKGRELLLNERKRSLSLLTTATRSGDTSVGRDEITPSISIPLGLLTI